MVGHHVLHHVPEVELVHQPGHGPPAVRHEALEQVGELGHVLHDAPRHALEAGGPLLELLLTVEQQHARGRRGHGLAEHAADVLQGRGRLVPGGVQGVRGGEAARGEEARGAVGVGDLRGGHLHLHVPLAERLRGLDVREVVGVDAQVLARAGSDVVAQLPQLAELRPQLLREAALEAPAVAGLRLHVVHGLADVVPQAQDPRVGVVPQDAQHGLLLRLLQLDELELRVVLGQAGPEGAADVGEVVGHRGVDLASPGGAHVAVTNLHEVLGDNIGELRTFEELPHADRLGCGQHIGRHCPI
mmetsp:Transcript_58630/g.181789  ORF Transcript_58630/g.181789 Transcript_58630/m.181789 type:complete len:301 (-) Transcript_58630:269-1171(-)